jgi:hypothetical protein
MFPENICAVIATYVGSDPSGDFFRLLAGNHKIWDFSKMASYCNGAVHSYKGKPAYEDREEGLFEWYAYGKLHRNHDRPARITHFGECKDWYQHGRLHRDGDKPASIILYYKRESGEFAWYQHGRLHRDSDKPAVITNTKAEWWIKGKLIKEEKTNKYWSEAIKQKYDSPRDLDPDEEL